jgi:hypothetical protein
MLAQEIGSDETSVIPPELGPIAALCDGEVRYREEGNRRFVYMEGLRFFVEGVEKKMDALLCLNHENAGYPTRLYLPEKVRAGLNWNENAYFFARSWDTWSWSGVSPDLPPVEILAGHLQAFTRAI